MGQAKRMPMHPVMPDDGQMVYEVQFRSPGNRGSYGIILL